MTLKHFSNRLVTRVAFFAVLLTIFGGMWRYHFVTDVLKTDLQRVLEAEQEALATYIANDINQKVELRREALEDIAKALPLGLMDDPVALENWLATRYSVVGAFPQGILVVPITGKGAYADFPPFPGRRNLNYSGSDWFRYILEGAPFTISKPIFGQLTRRDIVVMAVPLRDTQGTLRAVVAGTTALDTPGFLDMFQQNKLGLGGGYLLVSPRDQLFVTASVPTMRLTQTPLPGVNPLHDQAMKGWRGTGVTVNAFGVETLVAAVSVPAADWYVVAYLPTDEAFQPVDRVARIVLTASILAITLGAAALISFLTYTFRPMGEAARQMHRMAAGLEPLAKLPIVRHDEVGEMVEGFNTLVDRLQQSRLRLTHMAHHDVLTGLPNRVLFMARLEHAVTQAGQNDARLALLFIDLDDFKPVNDVHGHEVGDRLLKAVADRLAAAVRASDTVARFGGDEFVVLLTDVPDRQAVGKIAGKLIDRLSEPYRDVLPEQSLRLGASVGVGLFPDDSQDLNHLMAAADTAMYEAKRAGRNCLRFAGAPEPGEEGPADAERHGVRSI